MSLDLESDYKKTKDQINSYKSYLDSKSSYDSITEGEGDSLEEDIKKTKEQIDKIKKDTKRFLRNTKNQMDQLLDINNILSGSGGGTLRYVKNMMIKVMKTIEPIIKEILLEEAINAIKCDLQQIYDARDIYIKVSSLDIVNLLKLDPNTSPGDILYEKKPIDVQTPKFSMNRELYERIQSSNSFSGDYGGRFYKGASGQDLFDIQFVERNNLGITGPWYKVSLKNRADGINKVGQFLVDYYQSISIIDFSSLIANILNALSGFIQINANVGLSQNIEATKFSLFIQRILGLCFDNVKEIDVSGNAKVSELDGVDETFFEFTDLDLRQIETTVENIMNKVTEFEDCNNVLIPVNAQVIAEACVNLRKVPDEDLVDGTNRVLDAFADSIDANGLGIEGDFKAKLDFNFIKKIADGIINSLLSPKILLPIFVMLESIGQFVTDSIKSVMDFAKKFGKFLINIVSRIQAIFVKKLFELISKNIKQLLQKIIQDLAKEQADIKIIIILKLIQLAILIAEFVNDFRRCKSVIDEILWLLKIATTGWGNVPGFAGKVPYPLLIFSNFLDGSSATREFIGSIQEMQKLGIPTGALPDGSPNLSLLSKFGQMKAQQKEKAENGNVEIALSPLDVSPTRVVDGVKLYGKYF